MSIRWTQRFQNFERAFFRLREVMLTEEPNELEKNGLIQRYEYTIDLSWKLIKDYLEFQGHNFKPSPKDTLRLANQSGLIGNAQVLIDGLDIRNTLSHDYDGDKFEECEEAIRQKIYPELEEVYQLFKQKSDV